MSAQRLSFPFPSLPFLHLLDLPQLITNRRFLRRTTASGLDHS